MRDFAKISPQIWISERGREIKRLGLYAQIIAFYLQTSPHSTMIGIYYLPIAFIAHETGLQCEDIVRTLEQLNQIDFCTYDEKSEFIWVHDMAFEQIEQELKHSDHRVKGIRDSLRGLPKLPFLDAFFDKYSEPFNLNVADKLNVRAIEAPIKPLPSKEKEIENEKENKNENDNQYETLLLQNGCKTNSSDVELSDENLSLEEKATNVLSYFNETMGTAYLPDNENLNFILNHLKSGFTPAQCCYVITNKFDKWNGNPTMKDYLKLNVIFGSKFGRYVAELRKPKIRKHP